MKQGSKSLAIILAVGLCVVVILTVGLVLFYPSEAADSIATAEAAEADLSTAETFDPIEYLRNGSGTSLVLEETKGESDRSNDLIIVYGEVDSEQPEDGQFPAIVYEERTLPESGSRVRAERGARIDGRDEAHPVPRGSVDRAPQVSATATASAAGAAGDTTQRVAVVKPEIDAIPAPVARDASPPAATTRQSRKPQTDRPSAAASSPSTRTRTTTVRTDRGRATNAAYRAPTRGGNKWIQLIASPNLDRVEQARVLLSIYQLRGTIVVGARGSQTIYRLRFGPFVSTQEAEKFLDWLRAIPEFDDSFVISVG